MKALARSWKSLRSASYARQIVSIGGAYLLLYVVLFTGIEVTSFSEHGLGALVRHASRIAEFLFLDAGTREKGGQSASIHSTWSLANKFFLLLLTAFSSSLLTSKMISHQSKLRFSERLLYYSPTVIDSEQSSFEKACLVFRLLNDDDDSLYNVRISATLRYYHASTSTFQHYTCRVVNEAIPVLDPGYPFRIYVEMGTIASAIYTKQLCFEAKEADDIGLAEIQRAGRQGKAGARAHQLIVYIEGIDVDEGNQTTTSHRYDLWKTREGKFRSIQAHDDGFHALEVRARFDEFDPPDAFARVAPEPDPPGAAS